MLVAIGSPDRELYACRSRLALALCWHSPWTNWRHGSHWRLHPIASAYRYTADSPVSFDPNPCARIRLGMSLNPRFI